MKTHILSVAIALAASLNCFARLGETKDQIYRRYGPVLIHTDVSTNEWMGDYEVKNYGISVTFSNNISVSEIFSPRYADGMPRFLSDEERTQILNQVAGPSNWKEIKIKSPNGSRVWVSDQAGATAVQSHIMSRDLLTVSVTGYLSVDPKSEAKKRTKGL